GQKPPPPPTDNAVAYDLYLLGQQQLRETATADDVGGAAAAAPLATKAAGTFRSAIAADPKFAQADAGLARSLMYLGDHSDRKVLAEYYDRVVMPEVDRALAIDPSNSDAYFVKGLALRTTQRPGGSDAYRRAYELDPGNGTA